MQQQREGWEGVCKAPREQVMSETLRDESDPSPAVGFKDRQETLSM